MTDKEHTKCESKDVNWCKVIKHENWPEQCNPNISNVCGKKELPTGQTTHNLIVKTMNKVFNDKVIVSILHKENTSCNESGNWSVNSKTTKRKRLQPETHTMQVQRGVLTNQIGEQSIIDRKRKMNMHISTNQIKESERMMKKRKTNNEKAKSHEVKKQKYLKKHNIPSNEYQTACVIKDLQKK